MSDITGKTMSDIWYNLYKMLYYKGEHVESRIGGTNHITDFTFCLEDPTQSVVYSKIRKTSFKYLVAELIWYFSGDNSVDFIGKHAKMWNSLSDDGKTVNSAYGYRIMKMFGFNQLEFVIDKLKKNPYDRQAVIHIKDASNKPTKDTPCTCLLQFTNFNGKLNCHTYMRSNDIWFGTPYDVVFFTILQQIVSIETGIPLGKYYHTIGDLHIYDKNRVEPEMITADTICEGSSITLDKSYKDVLHGLKHALESNFEDDGTLPAFIKNLKEVKDGLKD